MTLRELQESMRAALHDGFAGPFLARIEDPGRFAIYASMYWTRQIEALASDFPETARLLGRGLFDRVAVTYLKRMPSRSPSLAWLGRGFEDTLVELGLVREAAVARLEWARNASFWAPDAAVIDAPTLGALGERLADATIVFHPSVRLVELAHGVREVVETGVGDSVDLEANERVVVFRQAHSIVHIVVALAESAALQAALGGAPVRTCCEAFLDEPEPDAAAIAALVRWVTQGWIQSAR